MIIHRHTLPLDYPPAVNATGKSPSPGVSTSSILPSPTDLSSDEKSPPQVNDRINRSIPAIRASNAQAISLTLEEPNHGSADSRQNNSGSTEQTSIDSVEMPTRKSARRSSGLDRMELPISFTPPRTESKDTQSHDHPFKKLMKISWKFLVIPLRTIMSIVKFLVMLLCIITSIVWAIPCIILFVAWSAAVFITAGDRCDDGDDDDDAFDTFLCWGVIPCCGTGFFPVLAIYGFKCIWSLGTVLVNPDNTSGLNNWIATSIHDILDSLF